MARNKYPQETVDKILDAALRLFVEKGYEHTTIQDIIDQLGGLTKGAIYHHFKNKEAIFYAIADRLGSQVEEGMAAIRDGAGRTGLEKLREMFLYSISGSRQVELNAAAPNMLYNPWLLAESWRSQVCDVTPHYIYPVILEGVADGSIHTDHPKELAELAMLACNVWLNPTMYPATQEDVARRLRFCDTALRALGLELLDEALLARMTRYIQGIARRMEE